MNIPQSLKYTKEHEWVREDGDTVTVGITDHAQGELVAIIFVEIPEIDKRIQRDENCGTSEAVKTVAALLAPISGTVTEIIETLDDSPESVNQDPYGDGWMVKVSVSEAGELDNLMSAVQYQEMI